VSRRRGGRGMAAGYHTIYEAIRVKMRLILFGTGSTPRPRAYRTVFEAVNEVFLCTLSGYIESLRRSVSQTDRRMS